MIKRIIKILAKWFKKEHKPVITVNESDGQIFVYSDDDLIIKAIIFPLRDKERIEQVTNLLKLLR